MTDVSKYVVSTKLEASSPEPAGEEVHCLVDHLFRHEAGRLVAALTRVFGPHRLGLAEEVVQESLMKALQHWPYRGLPREPRAWLLSVARRLAIDRLRREGVHRDKLAELGPALTSKVRNGEQARLSGEVTDDQLRLIFMCCHPDVPRDGRVALTLKTVCGFGVREIAGAFLRRESTIAQRLVRAKRRIRERNLPFELPPGDELSARLDTVLEVLYLLFGEGYSGHEDLVRSAFCDEALRLGSSLLKLDLPSGPARPTVHALMALMLFQVSRLPARLDPENNLVLLEDQDRDLWDQRAIERAFCHLGRSAVGPLETSYHLQAMIAAHHATAVSVSETDWVEILRLYDRLTSLAPSPVVTLNRTVALARVKGASAGIEALAELSREPSLEDYYLLPATRGQLLSEVGERELAAASFREALTRVRSEPERRFLLRRLADLEDVDPS